jgi:hypothetical protein
MSNHVIRSEVPALEVVGESGRETRRRIWAWTTSALRDLGYDAAVFVWSIVAFTVLVTGVSVAASLLVLIVGVFVWIASIPPFSVLTTEESPWSGTEDDRR